MYEFGLKTEENKSTIMYKRK